jgi:TorA maturation chaperone TorD
MHESCKGEELAISDATAPRFPEVTQEEQARAGVYTLLGALLAAPCTQEVRNVLTTIDAGDTTLPWQQLQTEITNADMQALAHEYHALFIGLGRGELLPYGSVYLTGFLQEKPLADLRQDLTRLGLETTEETHEPEDHAGALCEVMGLMAGAPTDYSHETQKTFFTQHVGSWMTEFFEDLVKARDSGFYRVVGEFGKTFIALEKQYFAMEV